MVNTINKFEVYIFNGEIIDERYDDNAFWYNKFYSKEFNVTIYTGRFNLINTFTIDKPEEMLSIRFPVIDIDSVSLQDELKALIKAEIYWDKDLEWFNKLEEDQYKEDIDPIYYNELIQCIHLLKQGIYPKQTNTYSFIVSDIDDAITCIDHECEDVFIKEFKNYDESTLTCITQLSEDEIKERLKKYLI